MSEQALEDMIVKDPSILSSDLLLIGRQEITSHGSRIDLLALSPDGSITLIEIKRDRTPREVVAQALDYASWVETLGSEKIAQIYERFAPGKSLSESFKQKFGANLDEDSLNQSHQIVVVAAELDHSSERIIKYLNTRNVPINVIFFQVFEYEGAQLLSRAWLIDPGEAQTLVVSAQGKEEKEPWNGEYYVSFGADSRDWEDARRYGFIQAGGGTWYSKTLQLLSPGDRIWARIPQTGYVGVGRVLEAAVPAKDFVVNVDGVDRPALDVLKFGEQYRTLADDPERTEYFVRVKWLDTVAEGNAVNEVGFFGNQNTVCRPQTVKWRHTVDRLKERFRNWQG